jgi:hypothetical protein
MFDISVPLPKALVKRETLHVSSDVEKERFDPFSISLMVAGL